MIHVDQNYELDECRYLVTLDFLRNVVLDAHRVNGARDLHLVIVGRGGEKIDDFIVTSTFDGVFVGR